MNLTVVGGKKIALGVCGGIAAYKVVELARELTQAGADVRVVMTPSATNFVGPITFSTLTGNPVRTELFPEVAPSEIPHTDLGRTSDLIVVAPATAKTISKFAQGLSDDLMSALLLSAACPVLMAPAMHTEMWENEGTQANVRELTARGVRLVGPESGPLAGPDVGPGRLAQIPVILEAIADELESRESMAGLEVLVTAGGTREAIDAVRFIGNRSSGRMGYEIAFEALRRGAKVTLITGPTALVPPHAAEVVSVTSAAEMREAVVSRAERAQVVVMAAAVADWTPAKKSEAKLKKSDGPPEFELVSTTDILAELGSNRGRLPNIKALVGFCAEVDDVAGHAISKLQGKNADLIVGNLVGSPESGFDVETNQAVFALPGGEIDDLGLVTKRELARRLLDLIAKRFL